MYNVLFLKGTQAQYDALTVKNNDTFYYADENLYLGSTKLSNAADLAAAIVRIAKNEQDIVDINKSLTTLTGTGDGSVSKMVADAKKELEDKIGDLATLNTTEKGTVVGAINELQKSVANNQKAGEVTLVGADAEGLAKQYTLKQGDKTLGTIDIPKDMVVSSGKVVVNPTGQPAGTYIEITLANTTNDKIYVNVGTLVDIYTAAQKATQIQLAIDSSTREISATIVAESVTSAELAADAVVTAKIADGNVTKVKLATDVQASLEKADSAVQKADVVTGDTNGTIKVQDKEVPVAGLKSAAYEDSSAFDAAGAADAVDKKLAGYKTSNDAAVKKNTDDIAAINNADTGILAQAKADAKTKADQALTDAKAYTDTALTWGTIQ